jgi:beta-lactamase regulating signal transducer with metallopeptidase domain
MTLQWIGEVWLPRLLAAGLQSLLLVAAIVLLVRWLRPSAAVRCWLWWCASLQLLLGALWPAPLELPLLPAQWRQAAEAVAAPAAPQLSPTAQLPFLVTRELAARGEAVAAPAAAPLAADWLAWPALFAALWLAGVIVLAVVGVRSYLGVRRRVAAAHDCEHAPALRTYRNLGASLGLRRLPPLRVSAQIDSPQLVGPPATVLLPQRQLAQLSDDELAMALHHELTHLRRRDLWWGWVPALARHLFFFHPLAHVIAREYAIAREQACDAAVLDSRRYAAHDYGRLLLRLGVAPRPATALAGASPTYTVLKRRLTMLQNSTSPARLGGVALAAAVAVLGLVPYKVTAAAEAAATMTVTVAPVAAAAGTAAVREESKVTIHHGKSAAGEQRITEIDNGDPRVWAIKDGQYFRVRDDGRYEPVRDAATRAHLDTLQRDAARAEVEAAQAEVQAERAMREAEAAGREAERAGRQAEQDARRAQAEGERARREAQQDHAQALRDAEQARRDADQALREAAQARAQGQRDREQALREGERARAEGQRAREQALRDAEQARRAGDDARRAGEQARRDAQQASRNGEQARRDAEQARRNGELARRDAQASQRNAEIARRNAEQARRNDDQTRRDADQARRNGEQAQRDADQAQRNADQAQRNAERNRQAALAASRQASESGPWQRDIEQAMRETQQAHRQIVQAQREGRIGAADQARLLAFADTARRAVQAIDMHAVSREAATAVQAAGPANAAMRREALRATDEAMRQFQRELADAGI